jgi:HSP20 family protein
MDRMSREMDRLFGRTRGAAQVGVYPALNLFDDGESLVVRAEVPGMDPKELELNATGKALTIAGERKQPEVDEGASAHRRERGYGKFRRAISLPQEIDPDKVQASYKLGVLEVVMPKAEAAKPRKIEVAS